MPPGPTDRDRFAVPVLILNLARAFNQHLDCLTDQRLIFAQGNDLLGFHDAIAALFSHGAGIRSPRVTAFVPSSGEYVKTPT